MGTSPSVWRATAERTPRRLRQGWIVSTCNSQAPGAGRSSLTFLHEMGRKGERGSYRLWRAYGRACRRRFEPASFAEAAWIDHSLGVVLAQRVSFDERPRNGTRVHPWGDIVHSGLKITGRTVKPVVTSFTETWYENFRCACDHLAEASGD